MADSACIALIWLAVLSQLDRLHPEDLRPAAQAQATRKLLGGPTQEDPGDDRGGSLLHALAVALIVVVIHVDLPRQLLVLIAATQAASTTAAEEEVQSQAADGESRRDRGRHARAGSRQFIAGIVIKQSARE
jgi:hypothetical protein